MGSSHTMKSGSTDKGSGNHDSLLLAAAEFVRVPVLEIGVQANCLEQLLYPVLDLFLRHDLVDLQWFGDSLAYRHPWVQGRMGVLKDDLHPTSVRAEFSAIQPYEFFAIIIDMSPRGALKLQDCVAKARFAAPAFTHQPQRFTLLDGKVDAVHGTNRSGGWPLCQR